jgi:hypothetical protein
MKQSFTNKQTIVSLLFLLIISNAFSQLSLVSNQQIDFSKAVTTIASGNWSNPAIWNTGLVPSASTDVIINDNHTVYIDIQGSSSGVIVDLCHNLQVKPTAFLRMGHNTVSFAKDLRINGSILCNGTFSSGRNQTYDNGNGLIYTYNSRIFLNLTQDTTYVSGAGFFNPKALSIASNTVNKHLIIDLYNTVIDENFAIKSDNRVKVIIDHFAYVKIKGVLGLTGSDYQFSAPTAKSDLIIHGIVVTDDVSLFTKNQTSGDSSSLTIANQGSLCTQKINKGIKGRKTEAAGFLLTINSGGLLRLGRGVDFSNLTTNNPNFILTNDGELRKHYSETIKSKAEITAAIDKYDPNIVGNISQAKDVFGASHIGGWYNFTGINESSSKPFIEEALDYYKTFGASSIKTTLSILNGKMNEAYPFNHTWPNFQTLKDVAQNENIRELFSKEYIKTHTFWTTTRRQGDFKKGPDFNHATYLNEEQQFYELTTYLLQTYGSMDKKFVYQNWEGDWMLRGEGVAWDRDSTLIPDDVDWITEGMARLFRARQRGTERARNEFSDSKAKVFHAVEFNKLWYQKSGSYVTMMDNGTPSVLGDVIPSTRIDLASWSAYDGAWTNSDNPVGHAMWKGIEIARYFTTQTGDLNAKCPVQIGEFAINENPRYNSSVTETNIRSRYGRYIGIAFGLGIPNFYLWNFYCSGNQDKPAGFTWEKGVAYELSFLNQWLDGKWLIKPDGNWGFAAKFLMEQWKGTLTYKMPVFYTKGALIYPNPTGNDITLKGVNDNAKISILDMNGRKIKELTYSLNNEINVSELIKGTYMVIIRDSNKPAVVDKLIKY